MRGTKAENEKKYQVGHIFSMLLPKSNTVDKMYWIGKSDV